MVDSSDYRLSLLFGEGLARRVLVHRVSGVRVKAVQYQDSAESISRAEGIVDLHQLAGYRSVNLDFRSGTLTFCQNAATTGR